MKWIVCEVLREALPDAYQNELITQGWQIMEQPWHATTDKLRTMEPMIQEKIHLEKQIKRLRVANNYSTDDDSTEAKYVDSKDNINNNNTGTDFSNDDTNDNDAGTDFFADDDNSVGNEEDPRGTHNSPYQKCKWCSKWHKRICFKPWPEKNDGDDITMSKAQLYSMISSVVRKELKMNQDDSESDNDLESSNNRKRKKDRKGWRKGQDKIAQALTAYRTYGKHAYNSDCSIDSVELCKNSNFGKEMSKKLKRM